jgi:hypothetical protein
MYLLVSLYIFYKYTLIHTFTTGDLRAGSCVRTSRPKVPLGLLMYVSHGRQHQRMALGACACSGRPPTGTSMLRRPITYWAGTFRAAAWSETGLGGSDSAAVKPASPRAYRKLRWPSSASGVELGSALVQERACISSMYWYVFVCICMHCMCIGTYLYMYWYVLVCSLV